MQPVDPPLLQQAATEVRYKRGHIYFDRCGSTIDRLVEALGPGFEPTTPREHTELRNDAERITVRFGPHSFVVQTAWPGTLVRFIQVAKDAWSEVGGHLGLEKLVTRVGVRIWNTFQCAEATKAEELLRSAGLIEETARWKDLFGPPDTRHLITLIKGRTHTTRVEVAGGRIEVQSHGEIALASALPTRTSESITLDMDFYKEGASLELPLTSARLADFARDASHETKVRREKLLALLNQHHE